MWIEERQEVSSGQERVERRDRVQDCFVSFADVKEVLFCYSAFVPYIELLKNAHFLIDFLVFLSSCVFFWVCQNVDFYSLGLHYVSWSISRYLILQYFLLYRITNSECMLTSIVRSGSKVHRPSLWHSLFESLTAKTWFARSHFCSLVWWGLACRPVRNSLRDRFGNEGICSNNDFKENEEQQTRSTPPGSISSPTPAAKQ